MYTSILHSLLAIHTKDVPLFCKIHHELPCKEIVIRFLPFCSSCSNRNTAENMQIHFKSMYLSSPIKFNGLILGTTLSDIIMIHSTWTPVCIFFNLSRFESLCARISVFFVTTILSQNCYRIYYFLFILPIIYAALIVNAPYFPAILVDLHFICCGIA